MVRCDGLCLTMSLQTHGLIRREMVRLQPLINPLPSSTAAADDNSRSGNRITVIFIEITCVAYMRSKNKIAVYMMQKYSYHIEIILIAYLIGLKEEEDEWVAVPVSFSRSRSFYSSNIWIKIVAADGLLLHKWASAGWCFSWCICTSNAAMTHE